MIKNVIRIFCLKSRKMFEHFLGEIGNFFDRISDPQISNQIDAAVSMLLISFHRHLVKMI